MAPHFVTTAFVNRGDGLPDISLPSSSVGPFHPVLVDLLGRTS